MLTFEKYLEILTFRFFGLDATLFERSRVKIGNRKCINLKRVKVVRVPRKFSNYDYLSIPFYSNKLKQESSILFFSFLTRKKIY